MALSKERYFKFIDNFHNWIVKDPQGVIDMVEESSSYADWENAFETAAKNLEKIGEYEKAANFRNLLKKDLIEIKPEDFNSIGVTSHKMIEDGSNKV